MIHPKLSIEMLRTPSMFPSSSVDCFEQPGSTLKAVGCEKWNFKLVDGFITISFWTPPALFPLLLSEKHGGMDSFLSSGYTMPPTVPATLLRLLSRATSQKTSLFLRFCSSVPQEQLRWSLCLPVSGDDRKSLLGFFPIVAFNVSTPGSRCDSSWSKPGTKPGSPLSAMMDQSYAALSKLRRSS